MPTILYIDDGMSFMEETVNKNHTVESVKIESGQLVLVVDGQAISRRLGDVSPRLANASEAIQNHFEVSPSGYGIHWPDCDEDLSIDALLGLEHKAPMMAAEEPGEYKTNNQ